MPAARLPFAYAVDAATLQRHAYALPITASARGADAAAAMFSLRRRLPFYDEGAMPGAHAIQAAAKEASASYSGRHSALARCDAVPYADDNIWPRQRALLTPRARCAMRCFIKMARRRFALRFRASLMRDKRWRACRAHCRARARLTRCASAVDAAALITR